MRAGSLVHAVTRSVADSSVPDRELLARFAGSGDAGAFELLVRRHADLVWRVCRGELPGDPHTAEDAFQATFLVLARKASAVREPSAAGFLFRVARNAAARARKRVGRVAEAVAELPAESPPVAETEELSAAVAAEVERLPDKFRLPVLLCFFEGCTHGEAAERLGWAVGTVASRLARAKDRLRDRLARRGLALPAALVAGGVSADRLSAAVTVATTPSTTPAAIPAGVSELTNEVLNAMWNAKARLVGGGVLAVLLAGGFGLSMLAAKPNPDEPKPKEQPKAKAPEKPEDAELKKMQGVWRVTRLETSRGVAPDKERDGMRWEIVGAAVFAQNSADEPRKQEATISIDPTKSPKQITMKATARPGAEEVRSVDGIYELKGNTFRLCFAEQGKPRPTEFKVTKEADGGLIELERIPDTIKGLKDLAGEWRVTAFDNEGKSKMPAEGMTAEFYRDVAWLITGGKDADRYSVELDADKGLIDLTEFRPGNPAQSRKLLGRFTWKDDKLTLVLSEPGKPRPAEATSGKDTSMIVLERGARK